MSSLHRAIPSVDRVLRFPVVQALIEAHGRHATAAAVRSVLADWRAALAADPGVELPGPGEGAIAERVGARLAARTHSSLRPVLNLTGTLIHTNLGRSTLPEEAIAAMAAVARGPSTLEYDLAKGGRGDRDSHIEARLCRLSGAAAASAVNNNAAALLLALNSLANRKEVIVSRGELIEIGDSFRLPDIMARAGCRLREVGTTNRTHRGDYQAAIGPRTALILRVHLSNFEMRGFTASVPEAELAALAHEHGLPLVVDLGSGALVDLAQYGLPHEPTAGETILRGADLVSFSGDKLLGGPQAGLIVGRKDLIAKLRRNPMKRALRLDKLRLAALDAVLRLYDDPDRLAARLPALRQMTRALSEIEAMARRLAPLLAARLEGVAVEIVATECQVGSGAQPGARLESVALALRPKTGRRGSGKAADRLAAAFRALPVPVIGRIEDGALRLDLRGLDDEKVLIDQLDALEPPAGPR